MVEDLRSVITLQEGATLTQVIQAVRLYLRDFQNLNRLVAGVESGERFIAFAVSDALADWNATPPRIGSVGIRNHPAPHLLVRRAAATVLEGVMHLQTRNNLSYSDGSNVSVNASDKGPQLQQIINWMLARYDKDKKDIKIAMNIEGGWGGVHSELFAVGGYYGFS